MLWSLNDCAKCRAVPCCVLFQATWKLITAPKESLLQTTYNVTATTFTPAELAEAIKYVTLWPEYHPTHTCERCIGDEMRPLVGLHFRSYADCTMRTKCWLKLGLGTVVFSVVLYRRRLPEFSISYTPDFRDAIAKTWPASIDDSAARAQWGWQPKYGEQLLAERDIADCIAQQCCCTYCSMLH